LFTKNSFFHCSGSIPNRYFQVEKMFFFAGRFLPDIFFGWAGDDIWTNPAAVLAQKTALS